MAKSFPQTGTAELLDLLSPFVPDDFINARWPHPHRRGRRLSYSQAQLFRVHLLAVLSPVHSFNLLARLLPEQPAWRRFAHIRSASRTPDVRMLNEFRTRLGVSGLRNIVVEILRPIIERYAALPRSIALIDSTDLEASDVGFKKKTGTYGAQGAALGARTIKMGKTRWYVGYKKHTLRLWLHEHQDSVQLVPLISWVTGANVYDGRMLLPSLSHCQRIWEWCPSIVVGDGAYLSREAKRESRLRWNVAILTRLRSDMGVVAPYVTEHRTECPQGELIEWRGFDPRTQRHWYGTRAEGELCSQCWEASQCPREFSFGAEEHEGLLGVLPSGSNYARLLLERTRPWVEPAQSYEKNQLGLNDAFKNSLRMTWTMSLLADAVVGMRARALTEAKPVIDLLAGLRGQQMLLGLPDEDEGLGEK